MLHECLGRKSSHKGIHKSSVLKYACSVSRIRDKAELSVKSDLLYVEYFPACVTYHANFNENGGAVAGDLIGFESTVLDMYKEVYLRCSECDHEEEV